jgi:hypothetical protein
MNAARKDVLRHREEKGQMTIPMTIRAKEPRMPRVRVTIIGFV